MARCGQIVGTPENCRRLLAAGEAMLVFPEGVRGINKPFRQRYQLQEFGLGFMRLALETGTPIVPVGVIGAEEQAPALVRPEAAREAARLPRLPASRPPSCPCPLPTSYRIYFGEPMRFHGLAGRRGRGAGREGEQVKARVQALLDARASRSAKHVFW